MYSGYRLSIFLNKTLINLSIDLGVEEYLLMPKFLGIILVIL